MVNIGWCLNSKLTYLIVYYAHNIVMALCRYIAVEMIHQHGLPKV